MNAHHRHCFTRLFAVSLLLATGISGGTLFGQESFVSEKLPIPESAPRLEPAFNGARNIALLGVEGPELRDTLREYRAKQAETILGQTLP